MEVDGAGENARANGGGGGDDNVVTSIERALLQYLLAARVVEDSLLRNFYNSVLRAFPVKPAEWPLELSVSALNQALLPLSLEVRTARLELDGLTWWGVVSTKGDDAVAALASNLSPEEVSFFKAVLDSALMPGAGGVLTLSEAMACRTRCAKAIGVAQAHRVLRSLVLNRWLNAEDEEEQTLGADDDVARAPRYVLGPRTLMDLHGYVEQCEALHECVVCGSRAIRALGCGNHGCEAAYHEKCHTQWFTRQSLPCKLCDGAARHAEEEGGAGDDDDDNN